MSNWSDSAARANAAQLRVFGEDVVYRKPAGTPLSLAAIRNVRDPQESESPAAFESIWTTAAELPIVPAKGDLVSIGSTEYVVHESKPDADPDSNGLRIYLNRRKPNA